MTLKFKNVYLNSVYTVAGPDEKKGLIKNIDQTFDDFYATKKSIEQAESHLAHLSMKGAITRARLTNEDIDLILAGDLLNQITASSYAAKQIGAPYFGLFSACAVLSQSFIIGANLISSKQASNILCTISSHNLATEKQYRFPNEYGGPKPKSAAHTVTAGTSAILSNKKSKVKITSGTIGTIIDLGVKNPYEMGAAMVKL
jgi:stage V sporulation protein AD